MEEKLAKRLVHFVGISLFTFALSMVALLNKYESADYSKDVDAMEALGLLDTGQYLSAIESQSELRDWLKSNHSSIEDRNTSVRKSIVDWLVKNGLSKKDIEASKGQRPTDFSAIEYVLSEDELKTMQPSPNDVQRSFVTARTVMDYLDDFEILFKPRKLLVATHLIPDKPPRIIQDNVDVNEPEFSLLEFTHTEPRLMGLDMSSFFLAKEEIVVILNDNRSATMQEGIPELQLRVPVKVETVEIPSIASFTLRDVSPYQSLYEDTELKERLRAVYGNLVIQPATSIASEYSVHSHKRIEIFGLSFSTRRFPFALLVIFCLVSLGNIMTLREAKSTSLPIISQVTGHSAPDMLLHRAWARTILWIFVPPIALWASLPPFPLGMLEVYSIVAGTFLIIGIGCWATVLASKL